MVNRLKSFAWRLGAYIVVAALAWVSNNIGLLGLPPYVVTIIALVVGEITKAVNSYLTKNQPAI